MNQMNYFRKYVSLTLREKLLLFEAVFFLFLAKLMLVILPFRFCIKTVMVKRGKTENNPKIDLLISLKYAISRANRLAFWKNVCLVQSLAARWMLQRRGISSKFSIGVAHYKQKELVAHAWLNIGTFEIVQKVGDYVELHHF
jgi:hypothetical protein